jgi:hypothetical protein
MDPKSANPVKFEGFLAQCWNEGLRSGRRLLTKDFKVTLGVSAIWNVC